MKALQQKTRVKFAGIFGTLFAISIFSTTVFAQEPYVVQEFGVSDDVKIEVQTAGGSIEVIGRDTDEVRVEMYVRERGREVDPGDGDLNGWQIDIDKTGNKVYAIAKRQDRSWGNNKVSISFIVYAPVRSTSELKTSGGSISLENLIGTQTANTSGGSIRAEKIGGDIELKTSGGSITINDIEGFVAANTSGGRISVDRVTGGIDVKTSGGSITLEEVHGNVEAKTSGGSITAEIVEPKDFIELKTSGGSISIVVPRDKGYDLELDGNRVRADLDNFSGQYERDEIEGTLNGGGTKISARTSGGSVRLNYL